MKEHSGRVLLSFLRRQESLFYRFRIKSGMTRYTLVLLLFTLCSLPFAKPVFAHVLQTSGTVGAVMHVDPNDDPVTGEVSTFLFEFKDTKNTFSLADCTCTVEVVSNNTVVYKTALGSSPAFTYTFPSAGAYTIAVHGTSLKSTFNAFTLSYIVRVENGGTTPQKEPVIPDSFLGKVIYHAIHYGLFIIGFIVLVLLVIREKKKNKNE